MLGKGFEVVKTLRRRLSKRSRPDSEAAISAPLRAELFGINQLRTHARRLAQIHEVTRQRGPEKLLARLKENEGVIRESHDVVAEAVERGRPIAPAAEWLLDNFYLIEEHVSTAREHLPRGYSRELPRLSGGIMAGFPRVYAMAHELVSHTDGRLDTENLSAFVEAYQERATLTLGELWAVPIMLRLTLIENLRRVAYRIAERRRDRDAAIAWADRFLTAAKTHRNDVIGELADFVREKRAFTLPFLTELVANLHGQHSSLGLVLTWLEQQLADQGQTLETVQQAESQSQAGDQVSIGHSIQSLRLLNSSDWKQFVEKHSRVEAVLRTDPAGIYPRMDFATRDRYRHRIERLARLSHLQEHEVAQQAVRLAGAASAPSRSASVQQDVAIIRQRHVGYYLLLSGRRDLRAAIGHPEGLGAWAIEHFRRHRLTVFELSIATAALGLILPVLGVAEYAYRGLHAPLLFLVLTLCVLFVSVRSAIHIVNWLATVVVPPRPLPRMDFSTGIPAQEMTAVVVPTLLTSTDVARNLIEGLELRYLANRSENLVFGLLTDFADAPQQTMPEDDAVLAAAERGIRDLNDRYAPGEKPLFFLLHRPRRWNPRERCWMGEERKRGKLAEFNELVLFGTTTAFDRMLADLEQLRLVRYVITLDTDTQLPPESAWKLVGTLAHPLNRPAISPTDHCVTDGYAVLQPRVAINLACSRRSLFSRLYSGDVGLDPYTREVSNVYHDLFGRSQFIGKGIYDIRAFHAAVGNRFPDNRILSHDLIEGVHASCGFVNDVEVVEEHPSRYLADVNRRHRWVRGDWQIAGWLLARVKTSTGCRRNPLNRLARWMILDNLRRSVLPLFLVATFLLVLAPGAEAPLPLMGGVLLVWFAPELLQFLAGIPRKPHELHFLHHVRLLAWNQSRSLLISLLELVFVPYQAVVNLDAIVRASWRLVVTRRRLLQWQTAHDADRSASTSLPRVYATMAPGVVLGAGGAVWLGALNPPALLPAAVLASIWLLSPALAWFISLDRADGEPELDAEDRSMLGRIARRTWEYYATHINAQHGWLPPDNVQELPELRVAPRTSPTNIGLGLIGTLAAWDFGYISTGTLLQRLRSTLDGMDRLERYRGHFFNWYRTTDGHALHPRYVSSVDSGNLAGCLVTLAQGLIEIAGGPAVPPRWREGLLDTLGLVSEDAAGSGVAPSRAVLALSQLLQTTPVASLGNLQDLLAAAAHLCEEALAARDISAAEVSWLPVLAGQLEDLRGDLRQLLDESPAAAAMPQGVSLAQLAASNTRRGAATAQVAADRVALMRDLVAQCDAMADVDLDFLFDAQHRLLSIGYDFENHRRDPSQYDLLASEARLASYLGVARGLLPQEHWFLLGRLPASGKGPLTLVSWSGSMFEYLMPMLFMPTYHGTLLHAACQGATVRQRRYGLKYCRFWGISESGYNQFDAHMNYQYRAFGVPGLGLKRGLGDDLVIAPYASAMATMLDARHASENLRAMLKEGFQGRYGLYEAVDFTPQRVPKGQEYVIVRQYMAHHTGMTLLSLASVLLGQPMQRRFLRNPEMRAASLLLQERLPAIESPERPVTHQSLPSELQESQKSAVAMRVLDPDTAAVPDVHLLSNGRYSAFVTSAGGGQSRWRNLALTRWRDDPTCDNWGFFLYLRDLERRESWSLTRQPMPRPGAVYRAVFSQGQGEFHCRFNEMEAVVVVAVSPEDDVEVRRMRITNLSGRWRTIELTAFAEAVLAEARAEQAHPAFQNLFVETQLVPARSAIFCTRRPRSSDEQPPWMAMAFFTAGVESATTFETDRARFLGRGRTAANPASLKEGADLSNSAGSVLDPAMAIRQRVRFAPNQTLEFAAVLGAAERRERLVELVDRYQDPRMVERVLETSWTHSQVLLHQIHAEEQDAVLFAQLAAAMLYLSSRFRADANILARNTRTQSELWRYGISGDLPMVLCRVSDRAGLELVRTTLRAQVYWRHKGLSADLVIWSEAFAGYRQTLMEDIIGVVAGLGESHWLDQPGGIFVRSVDQIPDEDRVLFQAAARVVLYDRAGSFGEQVRRRVRREMRLLIPDLHPQSESESPLPEEFLLPPRDLVAFNGIGGFTPDGREYVIQMEKGQRTPAPWCNLIANPQFGTVVTESGGGYTWYQNAHEYRLTPWYNDPVSDVTTEAFYVQDLATASFWSASPLPAPGPTPYVTRHGLGYTAFEHTQNGIFTEMIQAVPPEAAVKIIHLRVRNLSPDSRSLRVVGFCRWALGEHPDRTAAHIVTRLDPQTGAIFATNRFSIDFPNHVAFFAGSGGERNVTGDRTEFIGRHGSLRRPAALRRERLSNRVGPGMDPCGAAELLLTIPAGETRYLVFVLGAAPSEAEARQLVNQFGGLEGAAEALESVWSYWKHLLGALWVETPETTINLLLNNWLLYQVLSSRFWGRSGFYQSGGAYGFRDQLQDSMAFMLECPWLARPHLLLCASREFGKGDVQHWWHPPTGRGVRTHFSDDYLWLPLAAARYVESTGDSGVLDEMVPFLEGRELSPEEESYYDLPHRSEQQASLYDHCIRAIHYGWRLGAHGLPLMGVGDWNDGMNRVGHAGKGESVWLAFFLFDILQRFANIARDRGDAAFAAECTTRAETLRQNIELGAWDGQWYRRAYFDDGQPLGSKQNEECRIDALPQAWAVISGAADPARAREAMAAALDQLVDQKAGIIRLFTPPFDRAEPNPGYIRGYVPGVRENGGQYTHAAIWLVMAVARMKDAALAWKLLELINPLHHADTHERALRYKVEPYVVAADVYSLKGHEGRGGWTWYTGSAAWLYRLLSEELLGIRVKVDRLSVHPLLPPDWKGFRFHYRFRGTFYHVQVDLQGPETQKVRRILLDGQEIAGEEVVMVDDHAEHQVVVEVG